MGKARDFKTFPQATYQKINFSLDLFLQLFFKYLLFCGDMNINSIFQETIYYFWEFSFLIKSLLYVRQIQTINLPQTAPTHEQ